MRSFSILFPSPPGTACDVQVGRGIRRRLPEFLRSIPGVSRWVVVSDHTVDRLHGACLRELLDGAGLRVDVVAFPPGEGSKSRETKAWVEDRLAAMGAGRDAGIVAFGGGVVGDLAGFVAATWHRGIPFVQVPTTLLAMVDAGLGGKTAVNLPAGKNLVGAFHQPAALLADVEFLETLSEVTYRQGLAEAVKTAAILDARLFDRLESEAGSLRRRDPDSLEVLVERCLELKGEVVRRDPAESGRRAVLNFGHTVGHALETASGYALAHGDAVAIGMATEVRLAEAACGMPSSTARRVRALLRALGLPTAWPRGIGPDAVLAAMRRDKKVRDDRIRFSLPSDLAGWEDPDRPWTTPPESLVLRVLEEAAAEADATA